MRKRRALVLLGASLGGRAESLRRALDGLRALEGTRVLRVSRVYETAPIGPSDRPYLNQAALLETARTAIGLLIEFKRLEAAAGRRAAKRWTARELDLDLVALGAERVRTPWLSVPHPLMHARAFALAPLADVAPDWRLKGRRIASRLAAMKPDARIVTLWRNGR